ncbi:hypothetical protein L593_07275 [Salinarchaeum sp. Harcht-Bsk1]|uniref:hypothetical protein n=1 Tax=Salinarchaeum sp. Harcht-Bsk1 TaxID=1333523 RepID=UPI0003422889|nr:hypothetical protein [Salinarchaeum sp. Harcht-Bsk1]AGN01402.1 hypothetical protein L593_07275 [Salinarchaeum sp. Harcht-Bsk1]
MQRRAESLDRRLLALCLLTMALVGGLAVGTTAGAPVAGIAGGPDAGPPTPVRPASDAATASSLDAGGALSTSEVGESTSIANASAAQSSDPIVERVEYDLLPAQPDTVEARITYEIPDEVGSLTFSIAQGQYDVVGTDGFTRNDGTFEWDESGGGGTVTIRHPVTESFRAEGPDQRFVGGTGEWAIVTRPQTSTQWNYRFENPGLEYRLTTAGEGYAGKRFAFLGPHSTRSRTVGGEVLTLVVPDAADPASAPTEILDSVAYASDRLRFGNRNQEVVLIAAPTGEFDWGPPGLAIGADTRVAADQPVDAAVNVWVHEYVHTRQYRDADTVDGDAVADDAHWLVEGSADYYAALLSLEEGRIDYATFRNVLERGTMRPATDAVLTDRSTWADTDAEYEKGALVVGAIDRELRVASNGSETFQSIMSDWNSAETFRADDLEAAAERLGDESVREFVSAYTRTDATPSTWDRTTHSRLFGSDLPRFDYRVVSEPALSVIGPYRDGELPETTVVGEAVAAEVEVANVGNVSGQYRSTLFVGGSERAVSSGSLEPGETTTVSLSHRFGTAGDVRIVVGDVSRTVRVREPADPVVTSLRVSPRSPSTGDAVDVRMSVSNPTSRPADGNVTVFADGEPVGTERVQLTPGANRTVEISTGFDRAGRHNVSAGSLTIQLDVQEGSVLESIDEIPPVALATGLIALLAGATLLLFARSR